MNRRAFYHALVIEGVKLLIANAFIAALVLGPHWMAARHV